MTKTNTQIDVRTPTAKTAIFDIHGEINSFAETAMMDAYTQSSNAGAQTIILNFEGLEFMNSSGIGLLVTLLIRIQRQKQRLLAYGLSEHYRQIFEMTRLNEAILTYDDESAALQAAG